MEQPRIMLNETALPSPTCGIRFFCRGNSSMVHSLETATLACSLLRVKSHCVKTQQVSHAVLQAISTTYWAGLWFLERLPDDLKKNCILFGFILFCSILFVVLPLGTWDLRPPTGINLCRLQWKQSPHHFIAWEVLPDDFICTQVW